MSKCATCGGAGTVACPTCHGQGYTSRQNDDGETIQRLCGACNGKRQARCGPCNGTGEAVAPPAAAPPPAAAAAARPAAQPDRLAGRWKGVEGTWYEFTPDGPAYRATAGGPLGASATGTARLLGHKVTIDATDKLLGRYTLELMLQGNHLEGIDRKAGFPLPVNFKRA